MSMDQIVVTAALQWQVDINYVCRIHCQWHMGSNTGGCGMHGCSSWVRLIYGHEIKSVGDQLQPTSKTFHPILTGHTLLYVCPPPFRDRPALFVKQKWKMCLVPLQPPPPTPLLTQLYTVVLANGFLLLFQSFGIGRQRLSMYELSWRVVTPFLSY